MAVYQWTKLEERTMGTIPIVALPLVPHQKRFDFFAPAEFVEDFLDDLAHTLAVFNPRQVIRLSETDATTPLDDADEVDQPTIIYLDWDDDHADEVRSLLFDLLARHPEVVLNVPGEE